MTERRSQVLIVDDDSEVRALMRHTLEGAGCEVAVCATGAEAIQQVREAPPDLLILDLLMPEVDGWAVVERIHTLPRVPTIILVTTEAQDADIRRRALHDSIAGILHKPFRYRELVTLCEDVLRHEASGKLPQPGSERRRAPRRNLTFEVHVHSQDGSPLAVGRVAKLSPFGAELYVDAPLAPGRQVRMSLRLIGHGGVEVQGQLLYRHSRENLFVYGVAFADSKREVQQAIREALGQE